jgi:hypothetical protein
MSLTASRVEHALRQRVGQCSGRNLGGQPIRRVILAEVVALSRVDQTLVEGFEDIDLHIAQPEARGLSGNADDQVATVGEFEYPVEKVALYGTLDPEFVEGAAGKDRSSVVSWKIEYTARDRLGNDGEISVLQEQGVIADWRAVGLAQQPVPELAFQHDLGMRAQLVPQPFQHAAGATKAEAVATQLALHRQRVGEQIVPVGKGRLQPREQRLGARRIRLVPADLDKQTPTQFVSNESGAVGGDPKETAAGLPLALAQIIGEAGEYVALLQPQVALELEYDGAEQRVGAAMNFGQSDLVVNLVIIDIESVTEDIGDQMRTDSCPGRFARFATI